MTPVPSATTPPRPRPLVKRPWFWALMCLIGLVIVFGVMFAATLPFSSDTLRQRIASYLSDQLDSDVELGDLHFRAFPRLRVEGADLRIRKHGLSDYPPLISIRSFHVDASIVGLYRKHVDHVRLDGLDINIAPSQARDKIKLEAKGEKLEGRTEATSGPASTGAEPRRDPLTDAGIVIDAMDTIDARLIILPFERDKQPKVWAIHKLHMRELGSTRPWPFEATLTNGVPPGEIDVNGTFGPWHRDEPGDTPLEGAFMFAKADLGVFKGIAGTLSSSGYFGGTLAELEANGETYTPDFTLAVGGHPFPLYVTYQAHIDGTNGDTRLQNIDAWFLNSFLHAKGAVLDARKGQHGRTVTLDVAMDKSRIEDIMKMAVKTPSPPMVGGLKLNTKFLLPPGENDVIDRLRLDGQFWINKARFTNYDVQGKIEELSKRGRGKTAEPVKERVASDFQGRFKLGSGRLLLPDVSFDVPGARVELAGSYALKAETMDFKGQLLLDAKISQTMTGWRSLLLKVVDPLFKKKEGSGSAIPIKIGGSRSAPDFGLDVRRVFKRGN
jgi:hypothetical protein